MPVLAPLSSPLTMPRLVSNTPLVGSRGLITSTKTINRNRQNISGHLQSNLNSVCIPQVRIGNTRNTTERNLSFDTSFEAVGGICTSS